MRIGDWRVLAAGASILGLAWLAGCGQTTFPAAVDTNITEVDRIIRDDTLEPQEKRERLADLGFNDVTINALMRDERLANQFGGDLESALDKIIGDSYSTLTPDEIQAYGDAAAVTTFSDEAAQRIADLFLNQTINSADQLSEYLDDPGRVLDPDIDETDLTEVFVDFDPDDALDALP